jgi:hypothetical protein
MSDVEAATAAETVEEAEAKGFFGDADPRDRDEYALTSGPESPSAAQATAEARVAEAQAQLDEIKASASAKGRSSKATKPARRAEGA